MISASICQHCGDEFFNPMCAITCNTCTMTQKLEKIDSPKHYVSGDIECIDAMKANDFQNEFRGYLRLCAFKYLWRCNYKGNKLEDLKKAKWYIERLIKELENS